MHNALHITAPASKSKMDRHSISSVYPLPIDPGFRQAGGRHRGRCASKVWDMTYPVMHMILYVTFSVLVSKV